MTLIPFASVAQTREAFAIDVEQQGYRHSHAVHLANILYPRERVTNATTTRRAKKGSQTKKTNGRQTQ